jgi:threo-3-hydroxy-L-aspartate ammonia-lyase
VIDFADVQEAAQRLRGVAHRTPVVTSATLDDRTDARLFLKCENFQRMGAFKFRGAYNRIVQLTPAERRGGVVAYSSGNHAQGVALAAKLLGVHAIVVMPADAPESKKNAARGYGAEIIEYDRDRSHRESIAQSLALERGATLVPPFDDPRVMAGAGTAALELLEDIGTLDAIVTPVGGGGLLGASAVAAHGFDAGTEIYGVEPAAGDDFRRSLETGHVVRIDVPRTIADGLQTQAPSQLTFETARAHGARIATVSDDDLRDAMRFAFERLKLVVEPSGAAALAALLSKRLQLAGKRVGVVISGGNVDPARYANLIT